MRKIVKIFVLIIAIISLFVVFFNPYRGRDNLGQMPPPPKHGGIYVVAHRGAHNDAPENSLAAYQKAIDMGVDYIEVDIRTTKDGVIVSCHNGDIDAYVDGLTGSINDFTFDELQKIDIGIKKGVQWKGTRIPTFEEILKIAQGKCGIYLDLKEAPVKELVAIIKKYDMEEQTLWYSPSIRFWTFNDLAKECPICIPMPDPIFDWLLPKTLKFMKPKVIAGSYDSFSEEFAKKCHDNGSIVIIDEDDSDSKEWQKAIDMGADGIQTDKPEELIKFLDNR